MLIASPIGTCIGYAFTGAMISSGYSWRLTPLILVISMGVMSILLILIPVKYIDIKRINLKKKKEISLRLSKTKERKNSNSFKRDN